MPVATSLEEKSGSPRCRAEQSRCVPVPLAFTRVYLQVTQTFFRMYFSQDLSLNSDSGGQGCIERTAQVIPKANPLETQLLDPLWFVCFTPCCLLRAGIICFYKNVIKQVVFQRGKPNTFLYLRSIWNY